VEEKEENDDVLRETSSADYAFVVHRTHEGGAARLGSVVRCGDLARPREEAASSHRDTNRSIE